MFSALPARRARSRLSRLTLRRVRAIDAGVAKAQ
jgi:hypothetical protein